MVTLQNPPKFTIAVDAFVASKHNPISKWCNGCTLSTELKVLLLLDRSIQCSSNAWVIGLASMSWMLFGGFVKDCLSMQCNEDRCEQDVTHLNAVLLRFFQLRSAASNPFLRLKFGVQAMLGMIVENHQNPPSECIDRNVAIIDRPCPFNFELQRHQCHPYLFQSLCQLRFASQHSTRLLAYPAQYDAKNISHRWGRISWFTSLQAAC